ncbi:ribonuclease P [Candidatus Woesearchaeota archaeon]|nr:ribonuclease P [Candidatus Woesearchaeota archaeon]
MRRSNQGKPARIKRKALEQMRELFSLAAAAYRDDPSLSHRYVFLARKLAMKHKVSIPSELKRRFCKRCGRYLVPSVNARVRLKDGRVVSFCTGCRAISRVPYRKRKR